MKATNSTYNNTNQITDTGNRVSTLFTRCSYAQRTLMSLVLVGTLAVGTAGNFAMPAQAMASMRAAAPNTQAAGDQTANIQAVSGMGEFAEYGLVGFDKVELHGHTNSNIVTADLDANGQTFGTNNVASAETSILGNARSLTQVTTSNGSTVLVGPNVKVSNADCPNAKMLNGCKVTFNGGNAYTLKQVSADQLPNFEGMQAEAAEMSGELSELATDATYSDSDMNRRVVQTSAHDTSVISLNAATLTKYNTEVHVRGIEDGTTVVNIDALGSSDLNLPSIIVNDESNRERSTWSSYNVILNVHDSTSSDGQFHGKLTFGGRVTGIVLAPYASVTAQHNIDGQVIASNISIHGEFHRDSYTGPVAPGDESSDTEAPGNETPVTPETPETPDTPETPETPEIPDKATPEDSPGGPGSSKEETSEEKTDAPEDKTSSNDKTTSNDKETPGTPSTPNTPNTPGTSEKHSDEKSDQGTPPASEKATNTSTSTASGDSSMPKTGDAPIAAAFGGSAVLAGIAAAFASLRRRKEME